MRGTTQLLLTCVLLLSAGCDGALKYDFDGDGVEDTVDCAPEDAATSPGAPDAVDNGVDNNCDGIPGVDNDADGFASGASGGEDCNDGNSDVNPSATEVPNNEVDEDCDGEVLFCDADGDEVLSSHPLCGGTDCDDTDGSCQDEADCLDGDLDGVARCKGDCDDTDPDEYGGAPELCDGFDNDCDTELPVNEQDVDGDGEMACAGDCDDENASVASTADELCNGLDEDCSGAPEADEVDADADGFLACAECDDGATDISPGATETPYDGVDQDCDGSDLIDVDGDGFVGNLPGTDPLLDCNDADDEVFPGAADAPFDGLDTNCDLTDGVDADGDGWPYLATSGEEWQTLLLDCDDTDPVLNLDDADSDGSTTCAGDCDDADPLVEVLDQDGDGVTTCGPDGVAGTGDEDCDDLQAAVLPGGIEVCDGLDNDCSGAAEIDEVDADSDGDLACSDCDDNLATAETLDVDGDGYTTCGADLIPNTADDDCDDGIATTFPGAADDPTDGVDANCDGVPGVDQDQDGWAAFVLDCDDGDAALNLDDADGDGVTTCDADCDDAEPLEFPGNPEVPDWLDNDCNGQADDGTLVFDDDADGSCEGLDLDLDGTPDCTDGSQPGDCDDLDPVLNLSDTDGDGIDSCSGDCDDLESLTYPGAAEQCDLEDNDCDFQVDEGVNDVDVDADGFFPCQGDCDDLNPLRLPGAPERCDGLDNDCDGAGFDQELAGDADGDGWLICAGDCAPADPTLSPGAAEVCDGIDNDCDGVVDDDCFTCDLTVPLEHPTVQAAVDALNTGVVCVEPGTYLGLVDLADKPLHLVGLEGVDRTILDGNGLGSVVAIGAAPSPGAIVEGFTIQGGLAANGGGIHIANGSAQLYRLLVRDNEATANTGGIFVDSPTALTMSDVEARENDSHGIRVDDAVGIDLQRIRSVANLGHGLALINADGTVSSAVLQDNITGLHEDGGSAVGITSVLVSGNTYYGLVLNGPDIVISEALVLGNGGWPGGDLRGASQLRNVVFADEHPLTPAGGGLSIYSNAAVSVSQAAIVGNTSPAGGGVSLREPVSSGATFERVAFTDNANHALERTGTGSVDPIINRCSFYGNSPADVAGIADPIGSNGNITADPGYLRVDDGSALYWDFHLSTTSPLVDAGGTSELDPDGSPADIGPFGGPYADNWDIDGDGYPLWWHPGPYDPVADPIAGWDCDDLDPYRYPGHGC